MSYEDYTLLTIGEELTEAEEKLGFEVSENAGKIRKLLNPSNPTLNAFTGTAGLICGLLEDEGADMVSFPAGTIPAGLSVSLSSYMRSPESGALDDVIYPVFGLEEPESDDESAFYPPEYFDWMKNGVPESIG